MKGHEIEPHMNQETVTPLTFKQYEMKNVTGTSGWTKNLECYLLEYLPDQRAHRAASKSFPFKYKIQRTPCSKFFHQYNQ